jgi:uncharacterized Tic20 family protein
MSTEYPQGSYQPPAPLRPSDERLWSTLIHLSAFLVSLWGPLIGYLVLRERGPFVQAHTAAALNFQLSVLIYSLGIGVIALITVGIGALLYVPFLIAVAVFQIIAAVAANNGQYYTYPLTIRFVS